MQFLFSYISYIIVVTIHNLTAVWNIINRIYFHYVNIFITPELSADINIF